METIEKTIESPVIDEVIEAFRQTNLSPCRGGYYLKDMDLACALTALAFYHKAVSPDDPMINGEQKNNPVYKWAVERFGKAWTLGFVDGFDYMDCDLHKNIKEYNDGREVGSYLAELYEEIIVDVS